MYKKIEQTLYRRGSTDNKQYLERYPVSLAVNININITINITTPWTVAHQTPLLVGFSRQEYWSGLPFPSPKILNQ